MSPWQEAPLYVYEYPVGLLSVSHLQALAGLAALAASGQNKTAF